jgi:hypothetical protein
MFKWLPASECNVAKRAAFGVAQGTALDMERTEGRNGRWNVGRERKGKEEKGKVRVNLFLGRV